MTSISPTTAPTIEAPLRSEAGKELWSALIFALKTYAAAMLALFISFWAGLDEPRWAFLTVFIVSQPDSGLVLAKSFYRILGTIAGVIVSTALVFGLSQYGELFLALLAAWIAACCFASRGTRNFASYGFQLAGYTAAIIGLPAALNRAGAYDLIVARWTEILVGIACAALVSRLIAVRELRPKLGALVLSLTRRQDQFATTLLDPAADRERVAAERADIVADFAKVEAMQQSAIFESAAKTYGCRSGALRDRGSGCDTSRWSDSKFPHTGAIWVANIFFDPRGGQPCDFFRASST